MFSLRHVLLRFVGIAVLSSLCGAVVRAEILDGLYEVSVPVPNQSEKERRLALGHALEQVLVRASGQALPVLQANPVVQAQRSRAEDYLLEYRYGSLRPEPAAPSGARPSGSLLTVRFSPPSVRSLLAQASLPLWPRNRPTVLVWWQVEERGQRRLVMGEPFLAEAGRRGLPLVFPMNDPQDRQLMQGLWAFDADSLSRLAERYGISAVLVGRSRSDAAGIHSQWQLHLRGQAFAFPLPVDAGSLEPWQEAEILEDQAVAAVDSVVRQLLPLYAVELGGTPRQAELVLEGVQGFEAYHESLRYLQGLEAVRDVSLQRVQGQTLYFRLNYDGRPEVLRELLSMGRVMVESPQAVAAVADSSPPAPDAASRTLYYRYARP